MSNNPFWYTAKGEETSNNPFGIFRTISAEFVKECVPIEKTTNTTGHDMNLNIKYHYETDNTTKTFLEEKYHNITSTTVENSVSVGAEVKYLKGSAKTDASHKSTTENTLDRAWDYQTFTETHQKVDEEREETVTVAPGKTFDSYQITLTHPGSQRAYRATVPEAPYNYQVEYEVYVEVNEILRNYFVKMAAMPQPGEDAGTWQGFIDKCAKATTLTYEHKDILTALGDFGTLSSSVDSGPWGSFNKQANDAMKQLSQAGEPKNPQDIIKYFTTALQVFVPDLSHYAHNDWAWNLMVSNARDAIKWLGKLDPHEWTVQP